MNDEGRIALWQFKKGEFIIEFKIHDHFVLDFREDILRLIFYKHSIDVRDLPEASITRHCPLSEGSS